MGRIVGVNCRIRARLGVNCRIGARLGVNCRVTYGAGLTPEPPLFPPLRQRLVAS